MRLSIVCYLDNESTKTVRGAQRALGELTGARASLDLWLPHITVGDGIEIDEKDISTLRATFEEVAARTKPFVVSMNDILKIDFRKGGEGESSTQYGLYLDVQSSKDLLELVENVSEATSQSYKWYYMPSPYHPHCALAFKDLDKKGFELGATYLDGLSLSIMATIDHIALVEMLPNSTKEFTRFNFVK